VARASVRIKTAALIEALETKRHALEAKNEELEEEVRLETETLGLRQRKALNDAYEASMGGKVIRVERYASDRANEDEFLLDLPSRPWRSLADLSKYDDALRVLRLADPEADQLVGTDSDYARLLR